MIDALKKYNAIMDIIGKIYEIIESTTDKKSRLVSELIEYITDKKIQTGSINNIVKELKTICIDNAGNLRSNTDTFEYLLYYYNEIQSVVKYKEITNKKNNPKNITTTNKLLDDYNTIDKNLKDNITLINISIAQFNVNVDKIFIKNDQYNKLFKDKTTDNYELKDVTFNNYNDKIKDLIKLIKQKQNDLLENVFKIDKETIKQRLQNIFSELNLCDKYNAADDKSKKILDSLENDVKFTNSFKSLVDNLTAQSEDFQNIYKSNINKFNNIILQNIDSLH